MPIHNLPTMDGGTDFHPSSAAGFSKYDVLAAMYLGSFNPTSLKSWLNDAPFKLDTFIKYRSSFKVSRLPFLQGKTAICQLLKTINFLWYLPVQTAVVLTKTFYLSVCPIPPVPIIRHLIFQNLLTTLVGLIYRLLCKVNCGWVYGMCADVIMYTYSWRYTRCTPLQAVSGFVFIMQIFFGEIGKTLHRHDFTCMMASKCQSGVVTVHPTQLP